MRGRAPCPARGSWLIAALLALLANTSLFGLILAWSLAVALLPLWRGRRLSELAPAGDGDTRGHRAVAVGARAVTRELIRARLVLSTLRCTRLEDVGGLARLGMRAASGLHEPVAVEFEPARCRRPLHPTPATSPARLSACSSSCSRIVHLRRQPSLAAALIAGTAAILSLIYVEYSGGYRHHGHLFASPAC